MFIMIGCCVRLLFLFILLSFALTERPMELACFSRFLFVNTVVFVVLTETNGTGLLL